MSAGLPWTRIRGCFHPILARVVACSATGLLLASGSPLMADVLPPVWRWSNPLPQGADVYALVTQPDGSWLQTAEQGQMFTSDDLISWVPQVTHTTNALRAAAFLGPRAVIVGQAGTVEVSDDMQNFTLVNLNTTNWLESVAASSNLVVAVGDNASIYTSTNGVSWQQVTPSFKQWLNGVCFGGAGLFVAVGQGGLIATSSNGSTWTQVNGHTTQNLNWVAWLGNEFMAVGDAGVTLTSATGSSWQSVSSGATNYLYAVTGTTNAHLTAGVSQLFLQTNSTWANQTSASLAYPAPAWSYYTATWSTNSTNAFAVSGYSGFEIIGSTTNSPLAWRVPTNSIRSWLWQAARGVDHYVAVGNYGTILSSPDGYAWSVELTPPSLTNTVLLGVAPSTNFLGYTNFFMAVGTKGTVLWATNAFLWNLLSPPTTNDLLGTFYDGSHYYVCGDNGTVLSTGNLTTWIQHTNPASGFLSSMAWFPGRLVAVGELGTIISSTDRTNWAKVQIGTNWLSQVAYLNGSLVAVGNNGTILTSANGTNWISRSSGVTNWLNSVDFVGSTWFVAGNNGTVLGSPDLTNWVRFPSPTSKSLYGLAHSGGQLLAVGTEGIILRSLIVPPSTPVNIFSYAQQSGAQVFLFTGQLDQQFYLYSSTNLVQPTNWVQGPLLSILDDSGTLLYLTPAPTNSASRSFYRTTLVQ